MGEASTCLRYVGVCGTRSSAAGEREALAGMFGQGLVARGSVGALVGAAGRLSAGVFFFRITLHLIWGQVLTEKRFALKMPAKLTRGASATALLRALFRFNFFAAASIACLLISIAGEHVDARLNFTAGSACTSNPFPYEYR